MPQNPYLRRLARTAWITVSIGVILALISNAIDPTALFSYGDPGVEGIAAFWKFATEGIANGLMGIGIAAAIGATVLSGVEWRLAKNAGARAAERKCPEAS